MSFFKYIADAINSSKKTSAYDTTATVLRIKGSTAWVRIPGGVQETPVEMTIACKPGDTVKVRVSGGSAYVIGNSTAPPSDDTVAKDAKETAKTATETAKKANEAAEDAEAKVNYLGYRLSIEEASRNASSVTFIGKMMKGTQDVTSQLPAADFSWSLGSEDGNQDLGTGLTCVVVLADVGYGATLKLTYNDEGGN